MSRRNLVRSNPSVKRTCLRHAAYLQRYAPASLPMSKFGLVPAMRRHATPAPAATRPCVSHPPWLGGNKATWRSPAMIAARRRALRRLFAASGPRPSPFVACQLACCLTQPLHTTKLPSSLGLRITRRSSGRPTAAAELQR
jgi:hypothetical protein